MIKDAIRLTLSAPKSAFPMDTISNFVQEFGNKRKDYEELEQWLSKTCVEKLGEIHFLWESRVKAADSLETKLRRRNDEYKTEADNVADIKDLVGIRIILARWKDFGLVENMVRQTFDVQNRSQHSKKSKPFTLQ